MGGHDLGELVIWALELGELGFFSSSTQWTNLKLIELDWIAYLIQLNILIQIFICRIEPRYQELLSEDIPKAEKDGVEVKVIAGESMSVRSQVYTRTPTMFLDFTLKPRTQMNQSIPEFWNSFVYIIEGEGVFGSQNCTPVSAHHVLVFGSGDGLSVWNKSSKPLRFVLVGGQPLNEPVVQYGPFVMNTQAEIEKTIEDYQYSNNGFEMAKYWRSQWEYKLYFKNL